VNLVILTNDNFFSFTVLKKFLELRKSDIKLVVFSSALIGKRGAFASIKWSLHNTGFRHTVFKLTVYGVFRATRIICKLLPFVPNHYSSYLWGKRNNMNCICTADINKREVVQQIKSASPDLIISVSMNQIVRRPILDTPAKGCINVHCAPLPRYGGMSPYVWALAHNEDHSAVTIHYMEEGLDEGDIIVQDKVNIVKNDSAFSLFYRCCLRAGELLVKAVNEIEVNTVTSHEQDLSKKTYFSWPTKECVMNLHKNGYRLAKVTDFTCAIFNQRPRIE
jgi:folate-dependent phosphoribosylglycinamide formyltransferase PurN